MSILDTARLRLEPLDERHFEGLQAMNSQLDVMRFISGWPETPDETRASIARVRERWALHGFSWWAFIEHDGGRLVGAGCIQHLGRDPANPHEIGWRLVPDKWGQGLALEAARAMAAWAFDCLDAPLLVAICHPDNAASAKLMRRLGMRYRGLETWYEAPHVVHEITRAQWTQVWQLSSAAPPAPAARPGRPA